MTRGRRQARGMNARRQDRRPDRRIPPASACRAQGRGPGPRPRGADGGQAPRRLRPCAGRRLADRAAAAAAELLALAAPVDCVCCGAEDAGPLRRLRAAGPAADAQPVPGRGAGARTDGHGRHRHPSRRGCRRVPRGTGAGVLSFKSHGQGQLGAVLAQGAGAGPAAPPRGTRRVSAWFPCPRATAPSGGGGSARSTSCSTRLSRRRELSGVSHRRRPAQAGPPCRACGCPRSRHSPAAAARMPGSRAAPRGPGSARRPEGTGPGARAQRVRGSMRARAGLRAPDICGDVRASSSTTS